MEYHQTFLFGFKFLCVIVLVSILLSKVYSSYIKLGEQLIGSVVTMETEEKFIYPALTACISMDYEFIGNNSDWLPESKQQIDFPYPQMGYIIDSFYTSQLPEDSKVNMNNASMLNLFGLKPEDVWEFNIFGWMEEPCRCFTYYPKHKRGLTLKNSISFRVKTPKVSYVAVMLMAHTKHSFIPGVSRMFGTDQYLAFLKAEEGIQGYALEISRSKLIDFSTPDKPCWDAPDADFDSGLAQLTVGNNQTFQTIEQCYWDSFHKHLGCKIPWKKAVTDFEKSLQNCSTKDQFEAYKEMIDVWDSSGQKDFFNMTGCIPPCKQRVYNIKILYDSNFDCMQYSNADTDNATVEATFIFTNPDVNIVKKHVVYDTDDFYSDLGGFLGLFLGASCFSLVDLFLTFIATFIEKRRAKKFEKHGIK